MVVVLERPYPLTTRLFLDARLRLWTLAILAVLALVLVTKIAARRISRSVPAARRGQLPSCETPHGANPKKR